jgi:hypothetical protein
VTTAELIKALDGLRSTMISFATGGPRIQQVQSQFQESYDLVVGELASRQIPNPLPYRDLWQWHGRWSSDDLPTYASRRTFVANLFDPLLAQLRAGFSAPVEATGWERVERTVTALRQHLATAKTEEQFQTIGLLARNADFPCASCSCLTSTLFLMV